MRTSPSRRRLLALVIVVVLVLGVGMVWRQRQDVVRWWERATLPATVDYQPRTSGDVPRLPEAESVAAQLPADMNLAIPFTVQAPHANWDLPYKEFCEEASVLMTMSYINNTPITSRDSAEAELLQIKAFEDERFGYYEDTTAEETAIIIREHYQYDQVALIENPTVAHIKEALAAGRAVIVPVAGQQLGNPYFQQPGPLYHMLVIKGYTADGHFITNDPGTRRGA
ncbi:MAG: C39 family peptidase, partial [Candidatus Andersenbacteria bacterium]